MQLCVWIEKDVLESILKQKIENFKVLSVQEYSRTPPLDLEDYIIFLLLEDWWDWQKIKDLVEKEPFLAFDFRIQDGLPFFLPIYDIIKKIDEKNWKEEKKGDYEEIRKRVSWLWWEAWAKAPRGKEKEILKILWDYHRGLFKEKKLLKELSKYEVYPDMWEWWQKNHYKIDKTKEEERKLWEELS